MFDTAHQCSEDEETSATQRQPTVVSFNSEAAEAASLAGGTPGAAGPSAPQSHRQGGWRDELWATVVTALDNALRSYYNIVEFSDEPTCVLRIGRMEAARPVLLSDGTAIRTGETIGTIHFWNERLPPFSRSGPDVHWAVEMHRRVEHSFVELVRFINTEPDWQQVRAFCGEAALSSRIGDVQLQRVARHFGLEPVMAPSSILRQLHEFGECFSAWGLVRVYNPNALLRRRFFQHYQELWISRRALLARYGKLCRTGDDRPPAGRVQAP